MLYWKVECKDLSKLSVTEKYETFKSYSMSGLLGRLFEHEPNHLYYLNETGLRDRTCIEIPGFYSYTRPSELLEIMKKLGFVFTKSEKEMDVLIISPL